MPEREWIGAEDACERLGVRPQTLYAYVSRNPVRVRQDPTNPRRSLYHAADIAALVARRTRSRRTADVAADAIAWGEPVLESAITTVAYGRLFYRGRDAIKLAETETLESVARLLRGGHGVALKRAERSAPPAAADMRTRAYLALALRAATDPPARGRGHLSLAVEAATLLDVLADAVTGSVESGPIHVRLALAWGQGPGGQAADLIRRLLVLVADHELNPSAFAARVAASTGASLSASALAGLATLSGPRHGGASASVSAFADEADRLGSAEAVRRRLQDDRALPGFGHNLYPQGDPRAAAVLERFTPPRLFFELAEAVFAATGLRPNIDFALVAASQAMPLPQDAPFQIFTVARCAGWIAHAIEQGEADKIIRPRARYAGPALALD